MDLNVRARIFAEQQRVSGGFGRFRHPARARILNYTVEWRLITAGKARLELTPVSTPRPGFQVGFHLESSGLVSKLFKVEDDYLSTLNQNLCAQSVQLNAHEGSRQRETKITFDNEAKRASYLERDKIKNATVLQQEIDIPPCVHDVIGGIYQMRALNLEPGQATEIPVSDGKKAVMARIEAQQKEDIKTPAGTFKTTRYEVYLFNGVLYKRQAHMYVWLTDDRRKLPVQLRVRLAVHHRDHYLPPVQAGELISAQSRRLRFPVLAGGLPIHSVISYRAVTLLF